MTFGEFIESLTIFQAYFSNPRELPLGSEHDEIHVRNTDRPLSPEHAARLFALGWFQPYAKDDENGNQVYDPEEVWTRFV